MTVILPNEVRSRLQSRANGLKKSGYMASEIMDSLYCVTSPGGSQYEVDTRDNTCTCPSFRRGQYRDSRGRVTCKHLSGVAGLIEASDDSHELRELDTLTQQAHTLYVYAAKYNDKHEFRRAAETAMRVAAICLKHGVPYPLDTTVTTFRAAWQDMADYLEVSQ